MRAIRHSFVRHFRNATYRQYEERLGNLMKNFCPNSILILAWPNHVVYLDVQTTYFSSNRMLKKSQLLWSMTPCHLSIHRNVLSPKLSKTGHATLFLDSPDEGKKKLCRNTDSYLHSDMAVYPTKLKFSTPLR